jgi:hypothetical protein
MRKSAIERKSVLSSAVEMLESRRLYARQPFGNFGQYGELVITGTSGNDLISCQERSGRTIVIMNGVRAQFTTAGFTYLSVQAGDGADIVDFTRMTVPCYGNGGLGNDLAYGGAGNDSLTGAAGKDTLYGNGGVDRLAGGNTADLIYGGDGDDVVYGGYGTDVVYGEAGRNHLFGEQDADVLIGGRSSDGIYGGDGNDSVNGGAGNDVINGENGDDSILGGVGNDVLTGGAGADYIYGEAGDDTIDSKDNAADAAVDGGDGNDTVTTDGNLETPGNSEVIDGGTTPVDPPDVPSGGILTKGLSFGDELLWDEQFTTAVADAKALGVKLVRVWMQFNSYDDRPHAYDTVAEADIVKNWDKDTPDSQRASVAALAMKRAFQLKAAGFDVMATVTVNGGNPPTSGQQVKDFFTYLVNATSTSGGSNKLKAAVDYWEVGQEVDLSANWKPSGTNKTAGLKQYVDQLLIPAASVLHAGSTSNWEKVISASVTYNPNDMKTILDEANAQGQINALDYAGFHPYGNYTPNSLSDQISVNAKKAAGYAAAYGKTLAGTEWNVRGFATTGAENSWSSAIAETYDTDIAPNFGLAIYYGMIDNFEGRGGSPSARPSGLFHHANSSGVTPDSPVNTLLNYYRSPLERNQPFYDTFAAF